MKKFLLTILTVLMLATPASAEFFSDIIVTSPDGLWTDERAYASLADAITAVGAAERTIVVASTETVTDLTIPDNITLRFERGGNIANSGTLTFQTTKIEAQSNQIFTGTGDIDFAVGTVVKTSWFSNFCESIDQTNNDYVTLLITERAYVTKDSTVGDHVTIRSDAYGNRMVANAGFTLSNIGQVMAGDYQIFAGSGDFDFREGSQLKLSWFNNLRAANNWIETEHVTLVINGAHTVDYDETVTENILLDFKSIPGTLTVSAGVTLTLYSTSMIDAPNNRQIFNIAGTLTITNKDTYGYSEWLGIDGTADQTEINAALTTFGLVQLLGNKSYNTTAAITPVTASKLKGFGDTTIINTGYDGNSIYLNGVDDVSVSDLKIDGNRDLAYYSGYGISIAGDSSDISISNLLILQGQLRALSINPGSGNEVTNVTIDNIRIVNGCASLAGTNGQAIAFSAVETFGNQIIENVKASNITISDVLWSAITINANRTDLASSTNRVRNIYLSSIHIDGFVNVGFGPAGDAEKIYLKDFRIEGGTGAGSGSGDAVHIESVDGFGVSDGICYANAGVGLYFGHTTSVFSGLAARNGEVTNVEVDTPTSYGVLTGANSAAIPIPLNIVLDGIKVHGSSVTGISYLWSQNCTIKNSYSYSNSSHGLAVTITGADLKTNTNLSILGNYFYSNTLDGMNLSTSAVDVTVKNNICYGNGSDDVDVVSGAVSEIHGQYDMVKYGTIAAGVDDQRPIFACDAANGCLILDVFLINASLLSAANPAYETFTLYNKGTGAAANSISSFDTDSAGDNISLGAFASTSFHAIDPFTDFRVLDPGYSMSILKSRSGGGVGTDEMVVLINYITF